MTTLTTSWFSANYNAIDWTSAPEVRAVFYTRTPQFTDATNAIFQGYQSLADIHVEWVPIHSIAVASPGSIYARQFTSGSTHGLQFVDGTGAAASIDGTTPTGWVFSPSGPDLAVQEVVTAVLFYLNGTVLGVVNPILFATDQGIGQNTVVHDGALYGQFQNFAVTGGQVRVLTVDPYATPLQFYATFLLMEPALPAWESAHAQHIWLEPQRTNLIVNPSFENASLVGWRNSAVTGARVTGGMDPNRPYCGHFVGSSIVVESNYFPLPGAWMSISAQISVVDATGQGADLTFGLVGVDPSYTVRNYYCSDRYVQSRIIATQRTSGFATFTTDAPHGYYVGEYVKIAGTSLAGNYTITDVPSDIQFVVANAGADLPSAAATGVATAVKVLQASGGSAIAGFRTYQGLVQVPNDTPEMYLRIECNGCSEIWIDNVLVDPHEGQYRYFDGDSIDTIPLDYRWMGGRENNHFSCWYNNYLNTHNRLFSDWDENEGRYKSGLVEEWTPTGSAVIDHWDAITSFTPLNWAGDAFYPVAEVSGSPILGLSSRMDFQGNAAPS